MCLPGSRQPAAAAAPAILTVDGDLPGGARDFTLAEFEALGIVPLRTTTPWSRGPQQFSGVPLATVLQAVGRADATALRAEALNRYSVGLSAADAFAHGALLATRLAGEPMRVRDRGPIWLVYPWSEHPELDRPELHERSIWQLRRLTLL
jgi:hypothetical protein